ncbi:hypothetical protein AMS68_002667 [Peltaster fructicola]|uniref:Vacuolar protein sorting/targeting protein 10 n=1 Tax=Peltaster fructicola TaxID=286661 RepID=A0A6H0XRQ4_9PEZI|nr:hypothetical protein AMS68_002667 [Peltaster fructicola]
MAISDVNRNADAYVDFEKVLGIEGVAFANVVHNVGNLESGDEKQLKTKVTFNDGAHWELVRHKTDDLDDKASCEYSDECSLHLHGFTERHDPDRTYSSTTARGISLAHGNVGEFLGKKKDADTYMSTDGGATWKRIQKGEWAYAFGDRGSVIVIVERKDKVNSVKYTLDEGEYWQEYSFSEDEMAIDRITTVPSDTSLNFLLWGTIDGKLATVNIDFSGLKERSERCKMSDDEEDYDLWSVTREGAENQCLFGHIKSYHRKKPQAQCYNGPILPDFHDISKPCECTRADFECDYNHERQSDGTCKLVPGETPLDPKLQCFASDNVTEYYDITGYRRIPMTTCQGGLELEMTARTRPCDGYEGDYNRKHGISGVALFFAIVLPIAAASAVGWYVWRHWDGKFGRIQLGDGAAGSRIGLGGALDSDAPWIKYPVLALSAAVAIVVAIPMVISTVWRTVSSRLGRSSGGRYGSYGGHRYTSRGSFQRGRGNYSVIDPDEGELLGDESEDEM